MSNNWITLRDDRRLKNIQVVDKSGNSVQIKDAFLSNNQKSLRITLAATHAGIITRNNGFYLPDKMREGINGWVKPYPKPIQVHHQDEQDPIGRVVAARYIDTLDLFHNKYKDKVTLDQWTSIKDFAHARKYSLKDSLVVVDQLLALGVLQDPEYAGLGILN